MIILTFQAMELTKAQNHIVEANIVVRHLPRLTSSAERTEVEKEEYRKVLKSCWVDERDFWWDEQASGKGKREVFIKKI